MKKHFLTVCILMICTMFVACGKAGYRSSAEEPQSTDVSAGGMEDSYSDADRSGDASQSPEADHSAESGAGLRNQPEQRHQKIRICLPSQ